MVAVALAVAAAAWWGHLGPVTAGLTDAQAEVDRLDAEVADLQRRVSGGPTAAGGLAGTLDEAQQLDALLTVSASPVEVAAEIAGQAAPFGVEVRQVSAAGQTEQGALVADVFDVSLSGPRPSLAAFVAALQARPTLHTVDRVELALGDTPGVSFRLLSWRDGEGGLGTAPVADPDLPAEPDPADPDGNGDPAGPDDPDGLLEDVDGLGGLGG